MRALARSRLMAVLLTVSLSACVQPGATPGPTPSEEPSASTANPAPSEPSKPGPILGSQLPALGALAVMPGGHVSAIEFAATQPSRIFLASDVNAMGIWRSDDAGGSWQRVLSDRSQENAHQAALAIDPTNADLVISVDLHGKVWRTTDGGGSWSIVHDNHESTPLWAVAISPADPTRVFIGAQDGSLGISTDRGASWTVRERAVAEGFGSLALNPKDVRELWAGGQSGIHHSTDSGSTWTKIYPPGGLPSPQFVDVAVAADGSTLLATTPMAVVRSVDAGATWSVVLQGHAHDLAWSASAPQNVYVTMANAIHRSEDAGATWTRRDTGLPVKDARIAVHPSDPDIAVFGNNVWQWQFHGDPTFPSLSGEGVFKTADAGKTWQRSNQGFIDVDVLSAAIDPTDPNRIYVGTECSRGLYMTEDGGLSWRLISGGPQEHLWDIAHYTMQLTTAPDGRLHMTGRFGYASTADHGASWTSSLERRHFHGLGISPHDDGLLLLGTSYAQDGTQDPNYLSGNHILRSSDGGTHWTETVGLPNLPATTIQTFAFDPQDPRIVLAVTSSHDILEGGPDGEESPLGVFRSKDAGRTWMAVNQGLTNLQANGIAFRSDRIFLATDSGIQRSVDGGESWTQSSLKLPSLRIVADPGSASTLYAGTRAGLYASHDSGDSWQRVDSVPEARVSDLVMDPEGRTLVAVVNEAGVWRGVRD